MNLLDGADQTPDLRAELEAKWKDKPTDELLKAKIESDLYIKTLEAQKDELRRDYLAQREELLAKAKFEDYIDQIKNPHADLQVAPPLAKEVDSPRYDPKELEALVLNKINENEIAKVEKVNFDRVQNKLKERFGDNYANVLKSQQALLGLSNDDVNNLAKKSPEGFFRIMELTDQPRDGFQSPPRTNQRNDSFAPKVERRDYNYYQKLKQTNPRMYLDPKISVQMMKDAEALGDAFGLPD